MWEVEVTPKAGRWVVCIRDEGGTIRHSYPTKEQALYFAAVYRLQKSVLRPAEPAPTEEKPARAALSSP
jgi:hypothetical protein